MDHGYYIDRENKLISQTRKYSITGNVTLARSINHLGYHVIVYTDRGEIRLSDNTLVIDGINDLVDFVPFDNNSLIVVLNSNNELILYNLVTKQITPIVSEPVLKIGACDVRAFDGVTGQISNFYGITATNEIVVFQIASDTLQIHHRKISYFNKIIQFAAVLPYDLEIAYSTIICILSHDGVLSISILDHNYQPIHTKIIELPQDKIRQFAITSWSEDDTLWYYLLGNDDLVYWPSGALNYFGTEDDIDPLDTLPPISKLSTVHDPHELQVLDYEGNVWEVNGYESDVIAHDVADFLDAQPNTQRFVTTKRAI